MLASERTQLGLLPATSYARGTNGLAYQQILIDLPPLEADLLALLPYYTSALTEVGIGARDYLATQEWQAGVCGSIHAYTTLRGAIDNEQNARAVLVLSSKALVRNHAAQSELMKSRRWNRRAGTNCRACATWSRSSAHGARTASSKPRTVVMVVNTEVANLAARFAGATNPERRLASSTPG